jgi:hypothetical protein
MFHLPSLPSLNEVITSMEQEEIRQKVMTGEAAPVIRSALVIPTIPTREDKECYDCEKNDISAIIAPNHATLEEDKEVEDRGVDVVAEDTEKVVDDELLI